MKVIIAGSRDGVTRKDVDDGVLASSWMPTIKTVFSGAARGVDTLGEQLAFEKGWAIQRFPADWKGLGKRAGYARNVQMAKEADALIAVWNGASRGTQHMIKTMQGLHKPVFIWKVV